MDGPGVRRAQRVPVALLGGKSFVPVPNAVRSWRGGKQIHRTTFDEVTTTKVRWKIVSDGTLHRNSGMEGD